MVCTKSMLPKDLPCPGTPPGGSDHGYMVRDYQLPTRAIGRGFQSLQQRGHCLFALMAEMAEYADGDVLRIKLKCGLSV